MYNSTLLIITKFTLEDGFPSKTETEKPHGKTTINKHGESC